MQNLNEIYERDMSKLSDEKKAALQAVEDMKSTMLESKLSEVSHIRYSESHTLLWVTYATLLSEDDEQRFIPDCGTKENGLRVFLFKNGSLYSNI